MALISVEYTHGDAGRESRRPWRGSRHARSFLRRRSEPAQSSWPQQELSPSSSRPALYLAQVSRPSISPKYLAQVSHPSISPKSGIAMVQTAFQSAAPQDQPRAWVASGLRQIFIQGFLTNAVNPKVAAIRWRQCQAGAYRAPLEHPLSTPWATLAQGANISPGAS
jgi:hypothetical protein